MEYLLYLLRSSILLLAGVVMYRVLLHRLSFHAWKRIYLLVLLPAVFLLSGWSLPAGSRAGRMVQSFVPALAIEPGSTSESVKPGGGVIRQEPRTGSAHLPKIVLLGVLAGQALMLGRLGLRFGSLVRLRRRSKPLPGHHLVRSLPDEILPFSFGRTIYLNPAMHDPDDLQMIITHERQHIRSVHSVDIILAELLCSIHWFNPAAWLYRACLRENLEFQADSRTIASVGSVKRYQLTLLKTSGYRLPVPAIHFNHSSLKTRIMMLNQSADPIRRRWRFVPAILVICLVFLLCQQRPAIAQQSVAVDEGKGITIFVTDVSNGMPLVGARILDKSTGITQATDSSGRVRIRIPIDLQQKRLISVSTPDYPEASATIDIQSTASNLRQRDIEVNFKLQKGADPDRCYACEITISSVGIERSYPSTNEERHSFTETTVEAIDDWVEGDIQIKSERVPRVNGRLGTAVIMKGGTLRNDEGIFTMEGPITVTMHDQAQIIVIWKGKALGPVEFNRQQLGQLTFRKLTSIEAKEAKVLYGDAAHDGAFILE